MIEFLDDQKCSFASKDYIAKDSQGLNCWPVDEIKLNFWRSYCWGPYADGRWNWGLQSELSPPGVEVLAIGMNEL